MSVMRTSSGFGGGGEAASTYVGSRPQAVTCAWCMVGIVWFDLTRWYVLLCVFGVILRFCQELEDIYMKGRRELMRGDVQHLRCFLIVYISQ